MFERMGRSWELVREAWSVLRQDRTLVVFPILSGIFSLLAMAAFVVPVIVMVFGQVMRDGGHGSRAADVHFGALHYVLMFIYYLVTYFIVVFFQSALVACVRKRFEGQTPTVNDGLEFALSHLGQIFLRSLLAATVGTILRAVEERAGWLGRIVIALIGMAWTLAITFVVPVLVYEGIGPIDAVRRSVDTLKRTWGEALVGNVGTGAAFGILSFAGFLVMMIGLGIGISMISVTSTGAIVVMVATVLLFLVYTVVLSIIRHTLQGIFLTACYEYATRGQVPAAFTATNITQAWVRK